MDEEASRARQDEADRISKTFEAQIERLTTQSIPFPPSSIIFIIILLYFFCSPHGLIIFFYILSSATAAGGVPTQDER